MRERFFSVFDKIFVKKDKNGEQICCFNDINEYLKGTFFVDFLVVLLIIFLTLVFTIWTKVLYVLLFGMFLAIYKSFILVVKIEKCLSDDVKVVTGKLKQVNKPKAIGKTILDKKANIDIVTDNGVLVRLPVTNSFNAEPGCMITAYVPIDKCYAQAENLTVVNEVYGIEIKY